MNKIRKHPFLLILSIVSLLIGLTLIFSDYKTIVGTIYLIVGGGLIITGITKILAFNYENDKSFVYDGIINIIVGFMVMFVHNIILTIILGVTFVIFPIIRIVKSNDRKDRFFKELPLLIIGLVIALSGDLIAEVFVKILGVLFILFAIYLFVNIFLEKIKVIKFKHTYTYKDENEKNIKGDIIDVEYEESESDER